jgi:hypothetical protein
MSASRFWGLLACSVFAWAQPNYVYWPGAQYDPAIPHARAVLGHDFGERIAPSADVYRYFEALRAAAPNRVRTWTYAKSWQGRPLIYAVIGSEANLRRLDEIKRGMQRLADPRQTNAADARQLIANLPSITWLANTVHGNETSGSDAALVTAYHLLAATNDPLVKRVLESTLVFIDPVQNPDGRDRFIHHTLTHEGMQPDSEPLAAEHNESWPNGRVNHYLFDMNRDWFALTQPETKGRIKILNEWLPQVFADLHEMGAESHYFFSPDAVPYNPHLAKDQKDALQWFGRNNAKYFDQFGFSYFTREVFDAFYPGYGASWPSYYGGIAMTYENGTTRGRLMRRTTDDRVVEYQFGVRRQFTASIATCETTAVYRTQLLEAFYRYGVTALEEAAKENPREYVLPRRGNTANVDKLVQILLEQGVEIKRLPQAAGGYPAGSYVIPLAQPRKRLVRTLLDPQVSMDDQFLKAEESRRKRRLRSEIYDVTGWSVPLQFGVELVANNGAATPGLAPMRLTDLPTGSLQGDAPGVVAYLAPWGTNAAGRLLALALQRGLRVDSPDKAFTLEGRRYPAGTLIFKVADNPPHLSALLAQAARDSGAEIVGVKTSWVEDGPNFGSNQTRHIRKLRIAMAWDRPTSANSAGATRFVLEQQFGYPVTAIRTAQLATADLRRFDVLLFPESGGPGGESFASALGPAGLNNLKEWLRQGGTLVASGAALDYLSDPKVGLLAVSRENAPGAEPPKKAEDTGRVPGKNLTTAEEYDKARAPEVPAPENAQGFLARVRVDPEHWLAAGVPETVHALVSGRTIYTPLKVDKGWNAAVFAPADQVLASGYIWDEYKKQVAFKPFLMVQKEGRGNIIAFTHDPNYRGYLDGLNLLYLNAVFRGPSH